MPIEHAILCNRCGSGPLCYRYGACTCTCRCIPQPGESRSCLTDRKVRKETSKKVQRRREKARQFGITLDQLERLELKANGRCQICGRYCSNRLVIDHDHVTGKVRDLLCGHCNTMLGFAMDNPATLFAGAAYLLEHAETIQAQMSA
jgi:Recombination endonuclease VII